MAYYILINEDDSLFCSKKERLMQRQKLVNDLIFIVDPIYRNTHDMTKASVLLEYILPVSKKYETECLVLSDERYNDYFLQYKLPLDTNLSSEAGEIEIQLTFAYAEMDADGNTVQRIRKTSPTTIKITKIADWASMIPDSALTALDNRLILMNAQIQAIDEYMNVLDTNKVDNLVYNDTEETLQLTSRGVGVGDKVSVRDMLDDGIPVVDLDSNSESGGNNDSNSGCDHDDCDCHDNVVEFGYSSGNTDVPQLPDDDSNVVEF